jgi:hypothetical protein
MPPPPPEIPEIENIDIAGKKITVTGMNFAEGAVIFVDDKEKGTAYKGATKLVAKKGAKGIAPNTEITIKVVNPGGTSAEKKATTPSIPQDG